MFSKCVTVGENYNTIVIDYSFKKNFDEKILVVKKKLKYFGCENVWNRKCKKFKRDGGWEKEKMHHLGCAFGW